MKHSVYDTDSHFSINSITRQIINESTQQITLIQGDHNSERFTFKLPKEIEGHDMSLCDKVQIHYINIDNATKEQSEDVYEPDDFDISPDDPNVVVCSWLISDTATKYVGSLNFTLRFMCHDEDGNLEYCWNTGIYSGITISSGIYVGAAIVEDHTDILLQWEKRINDNQITSIRQTQFGNGDGGENIWTVTFGNGRTSELKVKNGSKGDTGLVGSIETVSGEPLHFFVGTQEEYNALSEKQNLFAIISDKENEEIVQTVETIEKWVKSVTDSTHSVGGIPILKYARQLIPTKTTMSLESLFNVERLKFGKTYSGNFEGNKIRTALPIGTNLVNLSYSNRPGALGSTASYFYTSVMQMTYALSGDVHTYWLNFTVGGWNFVLYVQYSGTADQGYVSLTTPEYPNDYEPTSLQLGFQKIL